MEPTINIYLKIVATTDYLLQGTPSNSVAKQNVEELLAELNSLEFSPRRELKAESDHRSDTI